MLYVQRWYGRKLGQEKAGTGLLNRDAQKASGSQFWDLFGENHRLGVIAKPVIADWGSSRNYVQNRGHVRALICRFGVPCKIIFADSGSPGPEEIQIRGQPGNKIQIRGHPRPLFADSGSPVKLYLQIRGPLAQKKYRLGVSPEIKYRSGVTHDPYLQIRGHL